METKRSLALCVIGITFLVFSCRKDQSWERVDLGFNDSFHDVEIINNNEAIAYSYGSGLIIKTTDRGESWTKVLQTDSIYFEQIEFPSEKIGFICGNTNVILKTTNGGNTWHTIIIDSIPENAPIYGMVFKDISVGYIGVLKRKGSAFQTDIYITSNSGKQWNKVNTIPEMILNLEIIDHELYGSGNNVLLKNIDKKEYKIIYKDQDNQVGQIRDFVKLKNEYILSSFNGYIIKGNYHNFYKQKLTENRFRSMVVFGDETLYVAGDGEIVNENIFVSEDKGGQWKNISKDSISIHRLATDKSFLLAIGKNDLLMKLSNE